MSRPRAIYLMHPNAYEMVYGPEEREEVASLVDLIAPPQNAESVAENPGLLADVEIILSGWGMVTADEAFLEAAPQLKAIFYAAGSIKRIVTEPFWDRDILITSSWAANAVPVIEFTLGQILISLKRTWQFAREMRRQQRRVPRIPVPGGYGSTVGLVSLGMIGSGVAQKLQQFDLNVIAYDPFVSAQRASELNVELTDLASLFERSDIVSLHTPWLPETEGMIDGDLLRQMKEGGTLINTARGAIIHEKEMIQVLKERPDLYAILDVTYPEPPEPGSPLFTLPNVVLTPHIAGSLDGECRRMGRLAVGELRRYLAGEPLQWAIDRSRAALLA